MRQIMVANQIYKLQTGDKHLPLLLHSLSKQNASNVSDEQSQPFYTSTHPSITSFREKALNYYLGTTHSNILSIHFLILPYDSIFFPPTTKFL